MSCLSYEARKLGINISMELVPICLSWSLTAFGRGIGQQFEASDTSGLSRLQHLSKNQSNRETSRTESEAHTSSI